MQAPECPKCGSAYTYSAGSYFICPECAPERPQNAALGASDGEPVKDSNSNLLQDRNIVTVFKDLKVKGSSLAVKAGARVKNIRLVDGDHNIDYKIDGTGP